MEWVLERRVSRFRLTMTILRLNFAACVCYGRTRRGVGGLAQIMTVSTPVLTGTVSSMISTLLSGFEIPSKMDKRKYLVGEILLEEPVLVKFDGGGVTC